MPRFAGAIVLLAANCLSPSLAEELASCQRQAEADIVSLMQKVSAHRSGSERKPADTGALDIPAYVPPKGVAGPFKEKLLPAGSVFHKDAFGKMLPDGGCVKCSSYPNVIRLGGTAVAGLLDRLTDLLTWSSLAQTVCAKVQPRPPCEKMLDYIGGDMAHNVTWQHFIDMKNGDGGEMFEMPTGHKPGTVVIATNRADGSPIYFFEQYEAARRAQLEGKPFEWNLNYDWLSVPQDPSYHGSIFVILMNRNYKCRDVAMHPSFEINKIAGRLREKLSLVPSQYIALHIRRGDSKTACDTAVEKVVSYVHCTLNQGGLLGEKDPVIFFTDATDPVYLNKLIASLSEKLGGRPVFHGDTWVSKLSGRDGLTVTGGNEFVFEVSLLIRKQAKKELLMDRTRCVSCEKPVAHPYCTYPNMVEKDHLPKCDFATYVSQAQLHVRALATTLGAIAGIMNGGAMGKPSCPQTTFQDLHLPVGPGR